MDPAVIGILAGLSSLIGTCICVELYEKYRGTRLEHSPLLVHPLRRRNLHWRMKNLLPVYNEERWSQPYSVGQGARY
jgi:hypothetical protein